MGAQPAPIFLALTRPWDAAPVSYFERFAFFRAVFALARGCAAS